MKLDYTHRNVNIRDILKITVPHKAPKRIGAIDPKYYKILFESGGMLLASNNQPFFILDNILDSKLRSYYLTDTFSRDDILKLKYNIHISKDGYYKSDLSTNTATWTPAVQNQMYLNFIEINSPLINNDGYIHKFTVKTETIPYESI